MRAGTRRVPACRPSKVAGTYPGRVNTSIGDLVERVLAADPRLGPTRLVLVDGPAGSGKTTLAERLARALDDRTGGGEVPIVHGDDIYEGWTGLATMMTVLGGKILEPLARGDDAMFRRWNWERGKRGDEVRVVAGVPILVIEGVGVAQRAARAYASLVVYVDAPQGLRLLRGVARDGEGMRADWERWQAEEAPLLEAEGTREASDVVLDGADAIPD